MQAAPELLGIHTMPGIFPDDIDKLALSGALASDTLSADEKVGSERLQFVYQKASHTASRWVCARRHYMESPTHRWVGRRISWITTHEAMSNFSHREIRDGFRSLRTL